MRFRFEIKTISANSFMVRELVGPTGSVLVLASDQLKEFLFKKGASVRQIEQVLSALASNAITTVDL
jgi:hypothetical protein